MLTKWVGQAWRELHANQSELICQTSRKLSLSLAVNGSEDAELSIRDLPGMVVGDWRMASDQVVDEQAVEDPVEIDEATTETSVNPGDNLALEAEYILEGDDKEEKDKEVDGNTGVQDGEQDGVQNESGSDLEDDLEGNSKEDDGETSKATG